MEDEYLYGSKNYSETIVAGLMKYNMLKGTNLKEIAEHGPLLDMGCGFGDMLAAYQAAFPYARAIGVDMSKDRLNEARKRAPNSTLLNADLRNLPFLDNSLPFLFSTRIYSYYADTERMRQILGEALRILKPGKEGIYLVGCEEELINHDEERGKAKLTDLIHSVGFDVVCYSIHSSRGIVYCKDHDKGIDTINWNYVLLTK